MTLQLWDAETGASIGGPLQGHLNLISSVAFSPEGRRTVSGSYDKTLRLRDAETGLSIGAPLEGHSNATSCVVFSPDNRCIVSGSQESTLRIWDADSMITLYLISMSGIPYTAPSFSPSGNELIYRNTAWSLLPNGVAKPIQSTLDVPGYVPSPVYSSPDHAISLPRESPHQFLLPLGLRLSIWEARGSYIIFGTCQGRVIIINCAYFL